MRRDLQRLASEEFDLLLIGGGVTGACIARDAAMRGFKVALVEKNDFANATSAHNSKLIHGGLRYLRNFELGLVRESLKERRIWQRIASHLVRPLLFLVPLYGGGAKARAMLSAGLTLYDVLSFDRGWLADPDQRLPRHRWLSPDKAIAVEPGLQGPGFAGAFSYFDAQMYSPERLALECLLDAAAHGAALANYVAAERLHTDERRVMGAMVRDVMGGDAFEIRAKLTIVAAGPWADIFLAMALGHPSSHKLLRSKGIHLVVPAMTREAALTVAAEGGHFFVLPWRGHSLLGTTDTSFPDAPDRVGVTDADIESFLAFINRHLPETNLKRSDVRHFYAGLRPLVDDGSKGTYGASRRSELVDHGASDGVQGLLSVIGGKWTTSRELAEKVVDVCAGKLGTTLHACATHSTPLPGAVPRREIFLAQQRREHCDLAGIAHLAQLYGSRLGEVLAIANEDPALRQPLGSTGDILAQVRHAMHEEMAMTLGDVVMRRTGVGQLGHPGLDTLRTIAEFMGMELGWSDARKNSEIETVSLSFQTMDQSK